MSVLERKFTAALIQMRSGTDQARNIADMRDLVGFAVAAGADYVQTPEMTGLVQRNRAALLSAITPDDANPVYEAAAELAARHRIFLHVGSTAVRLEGGKVANRAVLFAPDGRRIAHYDKIHMFDVDLDNGESWRESAIYEPGGRALVVAAGPVSMGLAICYDLRFPTLFRLQAKNGANVLTCPSCFTKQTGQAHWHVLMRARAIENGAYVLAAAQGGLHEDGRQSYGHSVVVDPWGVIIAELDHDEPGVVTAQIDIGEAEAAQRKIPVLGNLAKFEFSTVEAEKRRAGEASLARRVS